MHKLFYLASIIVLLFSCSEPKARRPVMQTTTNLYEGTQEQAKKLNAIENAKIVALIEQDSTKNYVVSTQGFWYYYDKKINKETPTPKKGEIAVIQYSISDLNDDIIYGEMDLGITKYVIDKQDLMPALQEGIKLMKVGETVTFVIPSYSAYGIVGDGNKIGINQSLKSTVTLLDILKQ